MSFEKQKNSFEVTFTTWGLPGGDVKDFSWHPNRSLHPEALVLGTTNKVGAHYNEEKKNSSMK